MSSSKRKRLQGELGKKHGQHQRPTKTPPERETIGGIFSQDSHPKRGTSPKKGAPLPTEKTKPGPTITSWGYTSKKKGRPLFMREPPKERAHASCGENPPEKNPLSCRPQYSSVSGGRRVLGRIFWKGGLSFPQRGEKTGRGSVMTRYVEERKSPASFPREKGLIFKASWLPNCGGSVKERGRRKEHRAELGEKKSYRNEGRGGGRGRIEETYRERRGQKNSTRER